MGANKLYIDILQDCLQVTDLTNSSTHKIPLKEVSKKELMLIRLRETPGIVYKKGTQLFFAAVPEGFKISGQEISVGNHLCGKDCSKVCKGCPRTADLTLSYQIRLGKDFTTAVCDSWRIEKYQFVTEGIEAFNMGANFDAMLVMGCSCYTSRKPKVVNISPEPGPAYKRYI